MNKGGFLFTPVVEISPTKTGLEDRRNYLTTIYKNVTEGHSKTVPGNCLRMCVLKTAFFSSGHVLSGCIMQSKNLSVSLERSQHL